MKVSLSSNQNAALFPLTIMIFLFLFWMAAIIGQAQIEQFGIARNMGYQSLARMGVDAAIENDIQEVNFTSYGVPDSGEGYDGTIDSCGTSSCWETLSTHTGSGTSPSYEVQYKTSIDHKRLANGDLENVSTIIAESRVVSPSGSTNEKWTEKREVKLRPGTTGFSHSVQTGNGILYMFGNAGVEGSVHVNRYINIQNNAVDLIGDVAVANKDSASNCAVKATGEIISSDIHIDPGVNRPSHGSCGVTETLTTLHNSVDVPPLGLPDLPSPDPRDSITANRSCGDLNPGTGTPKNFFSAFYWNDPGTNSIPCNVTLRRNSTYSLSGNVYISGDLITDNNVISNLTGRDIYVLVEGIINMDKTIVSSASSPVIFYSFSSCDAYYDQGNPASCSTQTNTPEENADGVQAVKTNKNAIEISGNLANQNAYFVARNGSIGYDAHAKVGSLAGETVVMKGNQTVTYIGTPPVIPGSTTWTVKSYIRIF